MSFPKFDFLQRLFRREEPRSGDSARNRLQLVLIQDRAHVCPELLDSLRAELVELISRYMIIDEESMSVELERKEGAVALAACIPVINIRRTQPEAPPRESPPVAVVAFPTEYKEEATVARSLEERRARRAASADASEPSAPQEHCGAD